MLGAFFLLFTSVPHLFPPWLLSPTFALFLLPSEERGMIRRIPPEAGSLSCVKGNLVCFTCWVYKTSSQMLTGKES